jgi:hypothetical protein
LDNRKVSNLLHQMTARQVFNQRVVPFRGSLPQPVDADLALRWGVGIGDDNDA